MATPVTTRPRKSRYLADTSEAVVHDLQTASADCDIDGIIADGCGVVIMPDTLEQAHSEGFENCARCIAEDAG